MVRNSEAEHVPSINGDAAAASVAPSSPDVKRSGSWLRRPRTRGKVPKSGYLSPAAAAMASKHSSEAAPGRAYRDTHISCCPCIESQALFKDKVFDYDGWQRHKSWRRHGPNPWVCLQVALYYWPPLLAVALISVFVGLYHTFLLPRGWPNITNKNFLAPFQLMSFVLSLLLVFRTNSAYGRWWEARIQWGTVVRLCRNMMRQIARWTIAMPYVLKAHVTELRDPSVQLQGVLLPHELQYLRECGHRPLAVGQALSDALNVLDCHPYKAMQINECVNQYMAMMGGMERLYRQPIPFSYTSHTSRFLVFWTCFLPFALWAPFQWLTPAVATVVSFLLLGVENIGVQIEQPFSVLPLELFCATVRANVMEQLKMRPRGGDMLFQAAGPMSFTSARSSTHGAPPTPQTLSRDDLGAAPPPSPKVPGSGFSFADASQLAAAANAHLAEAVSNHHRALSEQFGANGGSKWQADMQQSSGGHPVQPAIMSQPPRSSSWSCGGGRAWAPPPRVHRISDHDQETVPEDAAAEAAAAAAAEAADPSTEGTLPLQTSWPIPARTPAAEAGETAGSMSQTLIAGSGEDDGLSESERQAMRELYAPRAYGA